MPRRVPNSAKKKRTKIQKKRAVKRGDVSPPPQNEKRRRNAYRKPVTAPSGEVIAARRLQSSLVKLSPEFLQETRRLSATLPLPRPIPPEAAAWVVDDGTQTTDVDRNKHDRPTCPKRPKWRYEMSKKELEQNEQGFFKKWLDQTDSIIENWCTPVDNQTSTDSSSEAIVLTQEPEVMPKARASFERNLEVWRQLYGFHLVCPHSHLIVSYRTHAHGFALMWDNKMIVSLSHITQNLNSRNSNLLYTFL